MSSFNLMDDIISHLKSRKIKFVPRFAPYFIASFGAHVFNLYNKQSEVYTEHGRVPDTRMHTLFVAPPGFFKSFLMKILTNEQYGVLNAPDGNGKPVVPMRFESMVTEGGWTGSYTKDQKGATIAAPGLAQEFSSGIVCFEEFSAMTQTMKQQHSSTLDAALLTSLAEGEVRKRMVSGSISYETNITLWAGSVLPRTPILVQKDGLFHAIPISACTGGLVNTSEGWKRIKNVLSHYWDGNILGLNFHSSYVDITPNHSLYRSSSVIPAGALSVGSEADFLESDFTLPDNKSSLSRTHAFLQGFWCADGWKSNNHCYRDLIKHAWFYGQKDVSVLDRISGMLIDEFGRSGSIGNPRKDGTSTLYVHRDDGDSIFSQCISNGFKIVPSEILNSNDDLRSAFYEGFMLGDGSSEEHGNLIRERTGQSLDNQPLLFGVTLLNPSYQTIYIDSRPNKGDCLAVNETFNELRKPPNSLKAIIRCGYRGPVYDLETQTGDFAVGFPSFIRAHNTQQGRFDLASGLGRRLFFVNWVPSIREANELKEAFWAGMNISLDKPDLTKLRTKVCTTVEKINKVVSVQFDPQIKDFLMGVPHFEHSLFTRFCLGYHLMTSRFGRDVYVTADDSMKNLLSEAIGYREHLLASAEGDQVIQILIQSGGEASGQDICDRMLGFGSSVRQTRRILWYLTNRSRMITCNEKADTFKLRRKRRS